MGNKAFRRVQKWDDFIAGKPAEEWFYEEIRKNPFIFQHIALGTIKLVPKFQKKERRIK